MDIELFGSAATGTLIPIHGTDMNLGEWKHHAFIPDPLPNVSPELTPKSYLAVLRARAALAALDATAKQLPNPTLLRLPTLRREAQSTSALEGTYAPLADVLSEPTLTVSPWFEARRAEYYDRLFDVSARGDWDGYVRFFSEGIASTAEQTKNQMIALVAVQEELKDRLRASTLRADSAHALVDLAVANPSFTVGKVGAELGLSYGRANKLVGQLVELEILNVLDPDAYKRRFYSPSVMAVLIG